MRSLGNKFEEQAAEWLQARGLQILVQNFGGKMGEIDLIALDGQHLVFIEVRARSNPRFSGAAASIGRPKQQRIVRTAQFFLQRHRNYAQRPTRFDVVAFEAPQSGDDAPVRWIKAAFIA